MVAGTPGSCKIAACPHPSSAVAPLNETKCELVLPIAIGQPVLVLLAEYPPLIGLV